MKKLSLLVFVGLLAFSCNKDIEPATVGLDIKEFTPKDNHEANVLVQTFATNLEKKN